MIGSRPGAIRARAAVPALEDLRDLLRLDLEGTRAPGEGQQRSHDGLGTVGAVVGQHLRGPAQVDRSPAQPPIELALDPRRSLARAPQELDLAELAPARPGLVRDDDIGPRALAEAQRRQGFDCDAVTPVEAAQPTLHRDETRRERAVRQPAGDLGPSPARFVRVDDREHGLVVIREGRDDAVRALDAQQGQHRRQPIAGASTRPGQGPRRRPRSRSGRGARARRRLSSASHSIRGP